MTALLIDGDLFTLEDGAIKRFVSGKNDGWEAAEPERRAPAVGARLHPHGRRRRAPRGRRVWLRPA